MADDGIWTAEELMHGKGGMNGSITKSLTASTASNGSKTGKSLRKLKSAKGKTVDPLDWGMPGHLTEEEVEVFMKFKEELSKRDEEFKSTVFSFGDLEGEAYCLTRWLRARKFKYDDVIAMVEEAVQVRADARKHDFYPDPVQALGCEPSVFMAQYPQLYHGHAKNGCPVFISKPGVLNTDGMECITTLDGILKFHWYIMMHDYKMRLQKHKEEHPDFVNFQTVTVIDLEHLSTSQLSQRALSIVKTQTAIDSVCYPETMNRTLVINAPRFFTMTWAIVKGWLDPRTASKVELISSRKSWEARLRELVDEELLPSDYGGKGTATTETLKKEAPEGVIKQHHELVYVRSSGHVSVDIPAEGHMEIKVFSRSPAEVTISVVDESDKTKEIVPPVPFQHTGGAEETVQPTSLVITKERISGPCKVRVKIDSKGGRFSTAGNYMVACNIYSEK